MATTIYDRHEPREGQRTIRITDAGDRLRLSKQHSSKGMNFFMVSMALTGIWMAIVFWTASHIAPEPGESEGFAHEERDRPARAIDDPRTIGE